MWLEAVSGDATEVVKLGSLTTAMYVSMRLVIRSNKEAAELSSDSNAFLREDNEQLRARVAELQEENDRLRRGL